MAFHQYNKTQYNTAQYNADAKFLVVAPSETQASVDARIDSPMKVLLETVSNADARILMISRLLVDFSFMADVVTKSILNKGFSETMRTNDWLEIERKSLGNGNGWS